MKLLDIAGYSVNNLRYRKLRTWLTILGIVVGIATIIVLVSLADGLREDVNEQMSTFDPDSIFIYPANIEKTGATGIAASQFMPTSGKLFEKDYLKIKALPGVENIAKIILGRASVKHKDQIITASITAVEPSIYEGISTINIEEGRFLYDSDAQTAVLGYSISRDAFDDEIKVGSIIEILGKRYRVVGIIEKTGNSFAQFDNMIFIKFDEGKKMFADSLLPNEVSAIRVNVAEGYDVKEVGEQIEYTLMNLHKVAEDEKDFTVITADTLNEQIGSIIETLTIFLGAVALISLAVGTIGISNTMFMAVMERTKEVGVLKSIGASKHQVLLIFLIEAGIIGMLGGLLGILIGASISLLLDVIGVQTKITVELVAGSSAFAFLVGMVAGVVPAKNASEIPAIEALRYE